MFIKYFKSTNSHNSKKYLKRTHYLASDFDFLSFFFGLPLVTYKDIIYLVILTGVSELAKDLVNKDVILFDLVIFPCIEKLFFFIPIETGFWFAMKTIS